MNIAVSSNAMSVEMARGTAALVGGQEDGEQEVSDARWQRWELLSDLASALAFVDAHVIASVGARPTLRPECAVRISVGDCCALSWSSLG